MAKKTVGEHSEGVPRHLTVRISGAVFKKLENLKSALARPGEKERSLSDVARHALESANRIADPLIGQVSEPATALQALWATPSTEIISRHHWVFLADMGRQAYENTAAKSIDSLLLAANYQAFLALIDKCKIGHEGYFLGNLGRSNEPSLKEAVRSHIQSLEGRQQCSPSGASVGARNLYTLLRDESQSLSDAALTKALRPYLQSLLLVATKGHWYETEKPLPMPDQNIHYLENLSAPPREPYVKGQVVHLTLCDHTENLPWGLYVDPHSMTMSGIFPDLQDLFAVVLDGVDESDAYCVHRPGATPDMRWYHLWRRNGGARYHMEPETFEGIAEHLAKIRADERYTRLFGEYEKRYGRI